MSATKTWKPKCTIERKVGEVEYIDPYGYAWRVVRNDPDCYEVERDWDGMLYKPSKGAYEGTDAWFITEGWLL
jgi:hypothetical protein